MKSLIYVSDSPPKLGLLKAGCKKKIKKELSTLTGTTINWVKADEQLTTSTWLLVLVGRLKLLILYPFTLNT